MRGRRGVWWGIVLVACCLAGGVDAAEPPAAPRPAIGSPVKAVSFTDIRYLSRTLDELGPARAYVVVFTKRDCPLVKRYLPRIKALEEMFREQQVRFLALNVGSNDPLLEVAQQALHAEWPFPVGKDFEGRAAAALGVTRTPEVVVLDDTFTLRYRGRIDAQYRLSGQRPTIEREDLKLALEEILQGKSVSIPETPVDGCLIEFQALRGLPAPVPEQVTYTEHIAPLLAQHCQTCHREGMTGPFSLTSYAEARDHAEMIAEVVSQQRMPPVFSSAQHGEFINRLAVPDAERALIMAWVRTGCAAGDPAKEPPPRQFSTEKWKIGTPDLVIQAPFTEKIPAEGYVPYRYTALPHVFLHDTWIQKVEILPGNAAVVHHCNMGFLKLGEKVSAQNFVTGYVPGGDAMILDTGVGFKIPAGSILGLQIHYVTTGEKTTDRISVGLTFAKEPIQKELRHLQIATHGFEIPAGDGHFPLMTSRTLERAATGIGMFSHMHLRGKDMTFRALAPERDPETLLVIPNYNFDWQMSYRWAPNVKKFPGGTRIECTAHYDNSAFNPFNPDATANVREGQQTYQEMMYGFLFFTYDDEALGLHIDPKSGRVRAQP